MIAALALLLLPAQPPAWALPQEPLNTGLVPSSQLPANLRDVKVEQKLGSQVPLDLVFRDELGRPVRLGDAIGGKPVLLTLAYFKCPNLCSLVLGGVVDAIEQMPLTLGKDFRIITVSVNPEEGPKLALSKKRSYLARYARIALSDDSPSWRMLTGAEPAIRALAASVGYHYALDRASGEYSHPSVIMVLTPKGKVSQYFFGISFPPDQLAGALARASASRLGTPIEAILLFCFHYDPASGTWTLRILNLMRVLGALTVLLLLTLGYRAFARERAA